MNTKINQQQQQQQQLNQQQLNRRQWLAHSTAALGVAGSAAIINSSNATAAPAKSNTTSNTADDPFTYCLNTSTLRGHKLSIEKEIEIAAKAGYTAIEPWVREIEQFKKQGGKLNDLKKRLEDAQLTVESAIGFASWIVDDDKKRADGLEHAKRDMDLLRQIGGKRIAAPPTGATGQSDLNLFDVADRYRVLLELGKKMQITPQLEVWGFSKTLSRLGETALVAIESGHADACILPDVYHIYKGGSSFTGMKLLSSLAVHCLHMNDYPANPPRDKIRDADRIYPGDGVAGVSSILSDMHQAGFRGVLSLELFNPNYWKQDPLEVAKRGLAKMKASAKKALATVKS